MRMLTSGLLGWGLVRLRWWVRWLSHDAISSITIMGSVTVDRLRSVLVQAVFFLGQWSRLLWNPIQSGLDYGFSRMRSALMWLSRSVGWVRSFNNILGNISWRSPAKSGRCKFMLDSTAEIR